MGEFSQAKEVKKEVKRSSFRIFGTVVESKTNPKLLGYAVLDVAKYQTRLFSVVQTVELLKRYKFDNAKLEGAEIVNTECKMDRLLMFNTKKEVIGNKGITILGEVENSTGKGYRVINYDGKVTDLLEETLVSLVDQGTPILNGKKVKKSAKTDAHISAIKGTFPKLTKAEVDKLKKPVVSEKNKERYLQKICYRFKYSLVDSCRLDNWVYGLNEDFPSGATNKKTENTKEYSKFIKAIERYVKEYATKHHPIVVQTAKECLGADASKLEIEWAIVKYCTLREVLVQGVRKNTRKYIGYGRDFEVLQYLDKKFSLLVDMMYEKEMTTFLQVLRLEREFATFVAKEEHLTKNSIFYRHGECSRYTLTKGAWRAQEYFENIRKGKDLDNTPKFFLEARKLITDGIFNVAEPTRLQRYLFGVTPLLTHALREEYKHGDYGKEKTYICFNSNTNVPANSKVINLNLKSIDGIHGLGYCINTNEESTIYNGDSVYAEPSKTRYGYSESKKLYYLFKGIDITVEDKNKITKFATCFGDFAFAAKLLQLKQDSMDTPMPYKLQRLSLSKSDKYKLQTEAILTILACYNLDLAKYMNTKYELSTLDLDEIGKESFNALSEEDLVYYQTGGKFNKAMFLKGDSWAGLSVMPGGLRAACVLTSSFDFMPEGADVVLNFLYPFLHVAYW